MSDTEEQLNPEITSPPSTMAEAEVSPQEPASDVPSLSEDKLWVGEFNDASIAMCRALQAMFLTCATTLYTEGNSIIETSYDGGQTRITSDQKRQLQSVVETSVRNYTTLVYLTSTMEKIFLEFKRGITSNFAILGVLLSMLSTAVSSSSKCPEFTNADIFTNSVNYHELMKPDDACTREHTTTFQEKFYVNTEPFTPKPADITDSMSAKLSSAYKIQKYEATKSKDALRDTTKLEGVLNNKASAMMVATTRMLTKALDSIQHKFDLASEITIMKEIPDTLDPSNKTLSTQSRVGVFERIQPTDKERETAKYHFQQTADYNSLSADDTASELENAVTYRKNMDDQLPFREQQMVGKSFEELFRLVFGVSCEFIDDKKRPYSLCTYTLTGARVNYATIGQVLKTLMSLSEEGLKQLKVTGLDEGIDDKTFIRIMLKHYESRTLRLGDFYKAVQRLSHIVKKMEKLVSNGDLFQQLAKTLYSDMSKESYETLMTATGINGLMDAGFDKDILFQDLIQRIISLKSQKEGIEDSLHEKSGLASALHIMNLHYKDIMGELPPGAEKWINTLTETVFKVNIGFVNMVGNVSLDMFGKVEETAGLMTDIPRDSAYIIRQSQRALGNQVEKTINTVGDSLNSVLKPFIQACFGLFILYFVYKIKGKTKMNPAADLVRGTRETLSELPETGLFSKVYGLFTSSKSDSGARREIGYEVEPQPSANLRPTIGDVTPPPPPRQTTYKGPAAIQNLLNTSGQLEITLFKNEANGLRPRVTVKLMTSSHTHKGKIVYKILDVSKSKFEEVLESDEFGYSPFFGGAKTRRHKKRIGAASKHHKKRRRGTKKPSKRRRATRRKRR